MGLHEPGEIGAAFREKSNAEQNSGEEHIRIAPERFFRSIARKAGRPTRTLRIGNYETTASLGLLQGDSFVTANRHPTRILTALESGG
jgi:hypothetical protein